MGIEVRNLTHIYAEGLPDESVALENVSFTIEDNEFIGIIGHTGSGKSTLLQHLDGLIKPNKSGSIVIGGTDITESKADMLSVRRKIGLVFQYPEYQLFEESVAADVAFGPKNLGLPEEEVVERVREALNLVGMDPDVYGSVSPFELSGGQKRRIAIAGVVAMRPEVLILDEPIAGLDPKAHKDILGMIKRIHEEQHNITILVSHNMSDVAKLCTKVLVMDHGRLAMEGTPRQVFGRAEELEAMGLSTPPITKFIKGLKEAGLAIDGNPLLIDDGAEEILKVFGKR